MTKRNQLLMFIFRRWLSQTISHQLIIYFFFDLISTDDIATRERKFICSFRFWYILYCCIQLIHKVAYISARERFVCMCNYAIYRLLPRKHQNNLKKKCWNFFFLVQKIYIFIELLRKCVVIWTIYSNRFLLVLLLRSLWTKFHDNKMHGTFCHNLFIPLYSNW